MVRLAWHVEDGLGAHIPPNGFAAHKDTQVCHATCHIQIPDDPEPLQAIFTLPPNYLDHRQVRNVGVALAHGTDAAEWKGNLQTELAAGLAAEGYVVVRYHCNSSKEAKRQRMFEKAVDACATSPYADSVDRWVLVGIGSGARVAAEVARRCRGTIAACALLSYPLQEPMPVSDGAGDAPTDSTGPLQSLQPPLLFVKGDEDETCQTTALARLLLSGRLATSDTRLVELPNVDQDLKPIGGGRSATAQAQQQVTAVVVQFVEAIELGALAACRLPRPSPAQAGVDAVDGQAAGPAVTAFPQHGGGEFGTNGGGTLDRSSGVAAAAAVLELGRVTPPVGGGSAAPSGMDAATGIAGGRAGSLEAAAATGQWHGGSVQLLMLQRQQEEQHRLHQQQQLLELFRQHQQLQRAASPQQLHHEAALPAQQDAHVSQQLPANVDTLVQTQWAHGQQNQQVLPGSFLQQPQQHPPGGPSAGLY